MCGGVWVCQDTVRRKILLPDSFAQSVPSFLSSLRPRNVNVNSSACTPFRISPIFRLPRLPFPPAVKVLALFYRFVVLLPLGVWTDDLRNFQVHLAFNACKEILILWPTAKGAPKALRKRPPAASSQKGENKFHKGLCAPHWIFMPGQKGELCGNSYIRIHPGSRIQRKHSQTKRPPAPGSRFLAIVRIGSAA